MPEMQRELKISHNEELKSTLSNHLKEENLWRIGWRNTGWSRNTHQNLWRWSCWKYWSKISRTEIESAPISERSAPILAQVASCGCALHSSTLISQLQRQRCSLLHDQEFSICICLIVIYVLWFALFNVSHCWLKKW